MAAPVKKRAVHESDNLNGNKEKSESSDDSSENSDVEEYISQEKIQVDFEGRNPIDADFHGIKQLLQQLFLKAHVNLSELADLIIGQNYVGSVVKQSEMDDGDSDDDDESDVNDVFGVTSVVNLTEKQNLECVQQLRSLLLELCGEHATDQANTLVRSILSDDSQSIGLLINERIVNIPAQISVPLLESLSKEIKRACEKKMPYDFTYFVLICKLYKSEKPQTKKKKKKKQQSGTDEPEILWSNPEEELIDQEADCRFEFCVKGDSDSGLGGHWLEGDVEMSPYRRVLLLKANKLDRLIEQIKVFVSQQ